MTIMPDADVLAEAIRVWWPELLGVLLALLGGALAYLSESPIQGALALLLLLAFADRIRLRLDNRSLSAQVRRFQGRLREETGE